MQNSHQLSDTLGRLYRYPGDDYHATLDRCQDLACEVPKAAALLSALSERLAPRSVEALQELYIQTFELNPKCCLETGWQIFGERYERGEFLVYLRGLLREYHVPESTELPDHLTHVLELLARMGGDAAATLYTDFIGVAVNKMLSAIEGKDNPYELLVRATQLVMERQYSAQAEEAIS